jgi:hypothetical protein
MNINIIVWNFNNYFRYERFGTSHIRTLFNQFVAASCWCLVISNIFGTIPEVILTCFGPFNEAFCFLHTVSKNTLFIQFVVNLTAISVVRYVYIFMTKNPTGRNDEFICFFVNLATFINTATWQVVHQLTNGYNRHTYYLCCGKLPDSTVTNKTNYSLTFLTVLSPIVFIFILVKINLYKKKEISFPIALTSQSNTLPPTLGLLHKTSLADLVTVAIGLLIVVPSAILVLFLVIVYIIF